MSDEIDRHQRARLFAVAYRMLGSSHDAEDAVQESLERWHPSATTSVARSASRPHG